MDADLPTRLRGATQDAHQRLEDRLDILDRMATGAGRRELVRGFHAMHLAAETALSPWLSDLAGLDFEDRRRTPHLARDLVTLGVTPAQVAPPVVNGVGEALGRLYVLEGSSLGAKVIARQAALRGLDMIGLSFLDPYGSRTGERWRGFLAVLARESAVRRAGWDAEVVRGGLAGFADAEAILCATPVSA